MSFFYSAHKELNGLYWALGATCWAQQLLGLFLLWPFLFCACWTPVFLIEICVSLKCFTFWLTVIALWEIEFDPSVEARQVERELLLRKGLCQWKAVCRGWLVTWGANWSAVETVRAVSGVSMGSSWRYKPSCLLHAMSLRQRRPGTFSVTVDRLMRPILKGGVFLNTSAHSGAIALKTCSFWVVDELVWSAISTSLSNGPAFNSSRCLAFIVGGSYYKRP